MMYNEKLAVAIKCNGKGVREDGDTVYIPFGSEYSIFVKNLNNVRVAVKIDIDGEDIGNSGKLVLDANESVDLKRYLKSDNAFKFIEKTKEISEYRGDRVDDGLIRIEYWFEKKSNKPVITWTSSNYEYGNYPTTAAPYSQNPYGTWCSYSTGNTCDSNGTVSASNVNTNTRAVYRSGGICGQSVSVSNSNDSVSIDCAGITVKGSETGQSFSYTSFDAENESNVMVIQLKGETKDNKKVDKTIYTETKIKCPTCGKKNKSSSKFCSRCGTALF